MTDNQEAVAPGAVQVNSRPPGSYPEWGRRRRVAENGVSAAQSQPQSQPQPQDRQSIITMRHIREHLPVIEATVLPEEEQIHQQQEQQQQQPPDEGCPTTPGIRAKRFVSNLMSKPKLIGRHRSAGIATKEATKETTTSNVHASLLPLEEEYPGLVGPSPAVSPTLQRRPWAQQGRGQAMPRVSPPVGSPQPAPRARLLDRQAGVFLSLNLPEEQTELHQGPQRSASDNVLRTQNMPRYQRSRAVPLLGQGNTAPEGGNSNSVDNQDKDIIDQVLEVFPDANPIQVQHMVCDERKSLDRVVSFMCKNPQHQELRPPPENSASREESDREDTRTDRLLRSDGITVLTENGHGHRSPASTSTATIDENRACLMGRTESVMVRQVQAILPGASKDHTQQLLREKSFNTAVAQLAEEQFDSASPSLSFPSHDDNTSTHDATTTASSSTHHPRTNSMIVKEIEEILPGVNAQRSKDLLKEKSFNSVVSQLAEERFGETQEEEEEEERKDMENSSLHELDRPTMHGLLEHGEDREVDSRQQRAQTRPNEENQEAWPDTCDPAVPTAAARKRTGPRESVILRAQQVLPNVDKVRLSNTLAMMPADLAVATLLMEEGEVL